MGVKIHLSCLDCLCNNPLTQNSPALSFNWLWEAARISLLYKWAQDDPCILAPRLFISSQQTEFCELKSSLAPNSKFTQPIVFKITQTDVEPFSTCLLCIPAQTPTPHLLATNKPWAIKSLRHQHCCHSELSDPETPCSTAKRLPRDTT